MKRWDLPERVFFACGACHILAHAFLTSYPTAGYEALWIRPAPGFSGNHVIVRRDDSVFDYHGHSTWSTFWGHTTRKANRFWPGWSASLLPLPLDVLTSTAKSREYDGLWLREPGLFLHDPIPRALRYLSRFPAPAEVAVAG